MNPWDYVLPILGWIVLILLMFIFISFVFAVLAHIAGVSRNRKLRTGLHKTSKHLTMDPERLLDEVKNQAMDKYEDEIIERHEMIAFVAGAEFVMKQIYSEEQVNVSR